jgi:hypothetical protein
MLKSLYRFISYVFFPGTFALAGFVLAQWDAGLDLQSLGWITFFFGIFPVLAIYTLVRMGWISDIHIYERKQRNLSYPFAIAGAAAGCGYLYASHMHTLLLSWGLSATVSLTLLWILNATWIKVSAHMTGVSGFTALQLFLFLEGGESIVGLVISLVLVVLVYLARKGLSAHSHKELIAGICLGFLATFATLSL